MSGQAAYRAEIDGLRALAVIPVLLFHAGFSSFSGGFLGVDIFFVISGFLITGILLREMQEERFSLLRFYERRARRILPALFLVCFATLPFALMLMTGDQRESFLKSAIAVSFFASNVFFWLEDGYFAVESEEKPLLHTWTLAVEEQYYIFFPLFLLLLWPIGRRYMAIIIAAIALVSLGISEWGWLHAPNATFYLLPGRAWELLAGSLGAFLVHKKALKPNDMIAALGLLLIIAGFVFVERTKAFYSLYILLPVLGTLLILLFASGQSMIARALAFRPLVATGLVSYSLYLWHQPVFALARLKYYEMSLGLQWILIALSFVLAGISYILVEKPMRFRWFKGVKPAGLLWRFSIMPIMLAGICAILLYHSEQNRGPESFAGDYVEWNIDWQRDGEGRVLQSGSKKSLLLFGDSHARAYVPGLKTLGGNFAYIAEPSCISLPSIASSRKERCRNSYKAMLLRLEEATTSKMSRGAARPLLMIAQQWGPGLWNDKGERIGKLDKDNHEAAAAALLGGLSQLVGRLPDEQPIVVIGNVPAARQAGRGMEQGPVRCSQYLNIVCPLSFDRAKSESGSFNDMLRDWAANYDNVYFVDPRDSFCDAKKCRVQDEGGYYYSDDSHLSRYGLAQFMRRNKPLFDRLVGPVRP